MGPSRSPSLQSSQLLGSQGLVLGKASARQVATCRTEHGEGHSRATSNRRGGLSSSPSSQADWDGFIKQNVKEEPQGDIVIVIAVAKTWAPNLDILHVIQRMQFNTLVRANLQRLVVIVMRGGLGVFNVGLGGSSRANMDELGGCKGRRIAVVTLFWGGTRFPGPGDVSTPL